MKAHVSIGLWVFFLALLFAAACFPEPGAPRSMDEKPVATNAPAASEKAPAPPSLRAAYVASVQKGAAAAYRVHAAGGGLSAHNPAHGLKVSFAGAGVVLAPTGSAGGESLDISARQWGCEGWLESVNAAEPEARGNRAEYRRGELSEWYVNGPLGLEQGFTLLAPPACRGAGGHGVVIALGGGAMQSEVSAGGDTAVVRGASGMTALRVSDLHVSDATGRELASALTAGAEGLSIRVEDAGAAYPIVIDPLWSKEQTLTAEDGAAFDHFGYSVAISGDTAVVGAYGNLSDRGAAYVFVRVGSTWTEQQKLTAMDGQHADHFGCSVAISGDTVVVGAYGKLWSGAAYMFVRTNGTWTEEQVLTASDGGPFAMFGKSVAISGDTVVVGAENQESSQGAAYVFVRAGGIWTEQQKLTAKDGEHADYFGRSVAVSGSTVVVGSEVHASFRGAAYVFVRTGSTWTEQQELTASDGAKGEYFGASVAVSGDTVVAGAPIKGVSQGAAYVFVRAGGTWTEQQELTAKGGASGDEFGTSVAVSGDVAVGTALGRGAAYVFVRAGNTWTESHTFTSSSGMPNDAFGRSVAISGDTAVVGADQASMQGAAYVFFSKRTGEACSSGNECLTGFCVSGFCCDKACGDGTPNGCQVCSVALGAKANGTCMPFTGTACDDGDACTPVSICLTGKCTGLNRKTCLAPDGCHADGTCDATDGTCSYPNLCSDGKIVAPTTMADHPGEPCTSQADCASFGGYCVAEGEFKVCCNSPCDGLCFSCMVPGSVGKCVVEPRGMDLRGVCSPGNSCLRTCSGGPDCTDADEATKCSLDQCKDRSHLSTQAWCGAARDAGCPGATLIACAPFACDPGESSRAAHCRTACNATKDCASGFVCDPSQRCVLPPSPSATIDDALCGYRQGGEGALEHPRASVIGLLVLVALAPLRRGRRRTLQAR